MVSPATEPLPALTSLRDRRCPPPIQQGPAISEPQLRTAHAAVVLLMAAFFGEIAGFLTFVGTANIATAVLAGLSTAGISAPLLNRAIGR